MQAVNDDKYDAALTLLSAGADPTLSAPRSKTTVIHEVLKQEFELSFTPLRFQADFQAVRNWLEVHGYTFERAQADLEREGTWQRLVQRKQEMEAFARKPRE